MSVCVCKRERERVCVCVCVVSAYRARAACRCCRWCPTSICSSFWNRLVFRLHRIPSGIILCATFILITEPWPRELRCASLCASLNLQNYTVDNLPDIQRPLLRNPTRLLRRSWPHIGIPEPLASSRTFHPSLSSKGLWIEGDACTHFFFFFLQKASPAEYFF